jgi:hypothetical protein
MTGPWLAIISPVWLIGMYLLLFAGRIFTGKKKRMRIESLMKPRASGNHPPGRASLRRQSDIRRESPEVSGESPENRDSRESRDDHGAFDNREGRPDLSQVARILTADRQARAGNQVSDMTDDGKTKRALGRRSELRQAMTWSVILGPPKSEQSGYFAGKRRGYFDNAPDNGRN